MTGVLRRLRCTVQDRYLLVFMLVSSALSGLLVVTDAQHVAHGVSVAVATFVVMLVAAMLHAD